MTIRRLTAIALLLITTHQANAEISASGSIGDDFGIRFECSDIKDKSNEIRTYMRSLGISDSLIKETTGEGSLTYWLDLPLLGTDTTLLSISPEANIARDIKTYSLREGKQLGFITTEKEIILSLAQKGRKTTFTKEDCSVEGFADHVLLRKEIASKAARVEFGWPDGEPAKWNPSYWVDGTPLKNVDPKDAFDDMFHDTKSYEIGCYTVAKAVISGSFFSWLNGKGKEEKAFRKAVLSDGEPLVDIEPGEMWFFEKDAKPEDLAKKGKLLTMAKGIAPMNFVPGDWIYLRNLDDASAEKTGYEGSNAIYLGGGLLSDYYNDNNHSYRVERKMEEVYQWRNGVFSATRDWEKRKPIPKNAVELFSKSPEDGGLLLDYRVIPKSFKDEALVH